MCGRNIKEVVLVDKTLELLMAVGSVVALYLTCALSALQLYRELKGR